MSRKRATEDGDGTDNGLTDLPPLPAGWCWTTLEEIAEIEGGITKDQKRRMTSSTREVPYLRVANVQRGFLNLTEMKTILADEREIENLRLMKGDVLFTEGGDRDKLGRGWIWNGEIKDCIHQNHIFRARLGLTFVEPKFRLIPRKPFRAAMVHDCGQADHEFGIDQQGNITQIPGSSGTLQRAAKDSGQGR